MTNEVSLKPCPFCGSTDLSLQRKADPSPPSYPDGVCVIECWGCGALGPFCIEDQNAAKAWNDRGVVEPKAEPSVAALRMELAECRALLVDAIANPSQEDLKRAADWLANWDGKRIDVGAEAERVELNRTAPHE